MKVLAIAQDPGGVNAIAPVIEALRARGDDVGDRIEHPDLLLVGTSGGLSVEKEATARWHGTVPVVAVLDFWSNYTQRFSTPGTKDLAYLPDLICVMDDIARDEMIAEGFPPERLKVTGNPHFDRFTDGITRAGEDSARILFISQPIRDDRMQLGFAPAASDEYAMLEDLQAALPKGHALSIRLHPRDNAHKYDGYLGKRVSLAAEPTLEGALSHSGLIVGPATPVLMQAVAAGKKTLCYEPVELRPDPMVSNRVGVTVRIDSPQALADALRTYATGKWPFKTRPLREVWYSGATKRVVAELDQIKKV